MTKRNAPPPGAPTIGFAAQGPGPGRGALNLAPPLHGRTQHEDRTDPGGKRRCRAAVRRLGEQGTLQPLATLNYHPERRQPGESGKAHAGHGSADHSYGGVAFEPRMDPQHKRRAAFAGQVAARLEQAVADGGFSRLLLFASSPFLGDLKAALGPRAAAVLAVAADVDLMAFPPDEVARRVVAAVVDRQG